MWVPARRLVMALFALIWLPIGIYVSYTYLGVQYVPPVFLGELERSGREATSFAPSRAGEATGVQAFEVSFGSALGRPMDWESPGALETGGDSVELAGRRSIADAGSVRVDVTNRPTHPALRSDRWLRSGDGLLGYVDLEDSFRPHRLGTVAARPGTERPVSAAGGSMRAAGRVDERNVISNRDVTIYGRDLLSFDRVGLSVLLADDSNTSFDLSVAAERDGFGRTESLAGVRVGPQF